MGKNFLNGKSFKLLISYPYTIKGYLYSVKKADPMLSTIKKILLFIFSLFRKKNCCK